MRRDSHLFIFKVIEEKTEYNQTIKQYHELDHLAGTWSAEEARLFQKNTADFEKIDEDLWT